MKFMKRSKALLFCAVFLLIGESAVMANSVLAIAPETTLTQTTPIQIKHISRRGQSTEKPRTPNIHSNTRDVVDGITSVKLGSEFVQALQALQIQPGVVDNSTLESYEVSFPISGGAIDITNLKTEIIHEGGLSLTKSGTKVELTDFVITSLGEKPILTGLVTLNGALVGRITLFELTLPEVSLPLKGDSSLIQLSGVGVKLSEEAAMALNKAFSVDAFGAGFEIGTATVKAKAF
jgi:hypothetical protein